MKDSDEMTVLSLLSRKSPSTLRQLGGAFIQDYCGRFGHFGRTVLAYIEYKALWQCLVWTMIFGLGLAKGCCGGASLSCKGSSCYASLLGIGPRANRSSCKPSSRASGVPGGCGADLPARCRHFDLIEQGKCHSTPL